MSGAVEDYPRTLAEFERRFAGEDVPRPPHWGGYRLSPTTIEFWHSQPGRLHDRIRYRSVGDGWESDRLAP